MAEAVYKEWPHSLHHKAVCEVGEVQNYLGQLGLKLLRNLNVSVHLLTSLFNHNVITQDVKETVEAEVTTSRKVTLILDHLRRGTVGGVHFFISCIIHDNMQGHLLEGLTYDPSDFIRPDREASGGGAGRREVTMVSRESQTDAPHPDWSRLVQLMEEATTGGPDLLSQLLHGAEEDGMGGGNAHGCPPKSAMYVCSWRPPPGCEHIYKIYWSAQGDLFVSTEAGVWRVKLGHTDLQPTDQVLIKEGFVRDFGLSDDGCMVYLTNSHTITIHEPEKAPWMWILEADTAPTRVTVDTDNIYALINDRHTVKCYSRSNGNITDYQAIGCHNNPAYRCIHSNKSGKLVMTSVATNRIYVLDMNTRQTMSVGGSGEYEQLDVPLGACTMNGGRHVLVCDSRNWRIGVYTIEGEFVNHLEVEGGVREPGHVAVYHRMAEGGTGAGSGGGPGAGLGSGIGVNAGGEGHHLLALSMKEIVETLVKEEDKEGEEKLRVDQVWVLYVYKLDRGHLAHPL